MKHKKLVTGAFIFLITTIIGFSFHLINRGISRLSIPPVIYADNVCPSVSPSPSISPTPTPTPSSIITWSKNRKLTWDDFKAPVPSDAPADKAAESFVGVSSTYETSHTCKSAGGGLRTCTVTVTKVSATANFDPDKSWVRPGDKTDALLKHEQGHFDISEIFAMKKQDELNKLLGKSESATACTDEEALKEANKKLDDKVMKICDEINKQEDDMQKKYDNQTKNGTNSDEQKKWEDKIAKLLEKK